MPKASNVTEEEKLATGARIIALLKEEVFEIDGTPTGTVKFKDGTYKRKPMLAGAEFMLKDCYVGKRGFLIFIFEPVDAQEFTLEEDTGKVDTLFANFGAELGRLAGVESEDTSFIFSRMLVQERKRAADEKKAAEDAARKATAATYESNPQFGMF